MSFMQLLLSCLLVSAGLSAISSKTFEQDAQVLQGLKEKWNNIPESWNISDDPCGGHWYGITCDGNHKITQLILSSVGLEGNFPENIGSLTELTILDLSFNPGLTGNISPQLGDLSKLQTLALEKCSFTGSIPTELGNAAQLSYIYLFGNNLTGEIPCSIGKLSNLKWLSLGDNLLTGSIPVSTSGNSGLDQLKNLQMIGLSFNQLSGSLPKELFSSESALTRLELFGNQFTGEIPDTLYHIKTLQIISLGSNSFSGCISSSINTLTDLIFLHLGGNNFTGPVPDLTGMMSLNSVDLSNNNFDRSEAPRWFTSLRNLKYLSMENSSLYGPVPEGMFSLPRIQSIFLKGNEFNGKLDMSYVTSPDLAYAVFEANKISEFKPNPDFNNTVLLYGNPYCEISTNVALSACQPYPY